MLKTIIKVLLGYATCEVYILWKKSAITIVYNNVSLKNAKKYI